MCPIGSIQSLLIFMQGRINATKVFFCQFFVPALAAEHQQPVVNLTRISVPVTSTRNRGLSSRTS